MRVSRKADKDSHLFYLCMLKLTLQWLSCLFAEGYLYDIVAIHARHGLKNIVQPVPKTAFKMHQAVGGDFWWQVIRQFFTPAT